jgi:hypothetical protein
VLLYRKWIVKIKAMTNEEIINGNKLIAEFMGGIYTPVYYHSKVGGNTYYNEWYDCELKEVNGIGYHAMLKFHEKWDWLIPVCKKYVELKLHSLEFETTVTVLIHYIWRSFQSLNILQSVLSGITKLTKPPDY